MSHYERYVDPIKIGLHLLYPGPELDLQTVREDWEKERTIMTFHGQTADLMFCPFHARIHTTTGHPSAQFPRGQFAG